VFFWRPAIDRYFSYNVYLLANKTDDDDVADAHTSSNTPILVFTL